MAIFSSTVRIYLLVALSVLMGAILTFLQLSLNVSWLHPLWMVLVLFYWALMIPQYVNVGIAFIIGIILDLIHGAYIGEHGLALVLVVFLITKFRHTIISCNFWQQFVIIFSLIAGYQFLLFLIKVVVGEPVAVWSILGGIIVNSIVWPFLVFLLHNCRLKLHIENNY